MSTAKRATKAKEKKTPGTVMAEEARARANRLTDEERAALMADAMRIIYSADSKPAHAHRR